MPVQGQRERETSGPPAQQGSGGQGRRNCYRTRFQLFLPEGHGQCRSPRGDCPGESGAQAQASATVGGFTLGQSLDWSGLTLIRCEKTEACTPPSISFTGLPSLCSTHSHRRGRWDLPRMQSSQIHWLLPMSFFLFAPYLCPLFSPSCVTPVDPRDPPGARGKLSGQATHSPGSLDLNLELVPLPPFTLPPHSPAPGGLILNTHNFPFLAASLLSTLSVACWHAGELGTWLFTN